MYYEKKGFKIATDFNTTRYTTEIKEFIKKPARTIVHLLHRTTNKKLSQREDSQELLSKNISHFITHVFTNRKNDTLYQTICIELLNARDDGTNPFDDLFLAIGNQIRFWAETDKMYRNFTDENDFKCMKDRQILSEQPNNSTKVTFFVSLVQFLMQYSMILCHMHGKQRHKRRCYQCQAASQSKQTPGKE